MFQSKILALEKDLQCTKELCEKQKKESVENTNKFFVMQDQIFKLNTDIDSLKIENSKYKRKLISINKTKDSLNSKIKELQRLLKIKFSRTILEEKEKAEKEIIQMLSTIFTKAQLDMILKVKKKCNGKQRIYQLHLLCGTIANAAIFF